MNVIKQMLPQRRIRKGITLIEAAIVVGVIGAVLGAVFGAATLANYRVTLNQASDELNRIVFNMRNFYAGQIAPNPGCVTPTFANMSNYITSGIFPPEMITSSGVANNVWNLGSTTSTAEVDLIKCTSTSVVVRYLTVPAETCVDILMRNSLPGRDTGLTQIIVGGGSTTFTSALNQLPVTPIAAQSACAQAAASSYTIDWYYNLNN